MTKDDLARENAALRKRIEALEARLAAVEARSVPPVVVWPSRPYEPWPTYLSQPRIWCGSAESIRTTDRTTTTSAIRRFEPIP